MSDFFHALDDPDMVFFRYAVLTGMVAGVAFGIVGTYVVVRRITYIAGAIAHCILGGIGMALYLQYRLQAPWITPMSGAIAAALFSALTIGIVSMHWKQREDAVISAMWAVGMALGVLFIALTPGYQSAMSYLFGDILMVSREDFYTVLGLDVAIVALCLLFYNKFLAVCFDSDFARIKGVKVDFYYLLLLCLTALTIVLLISVVGLIMVIALLTLPAAISGHFTRRLWKMMFFSVILSILFTFFGLGLSYRWNVPSGAVIIIIAGVCYLLTAAGTAFWRRIRNRVE
ncbi:MAG: metal ABC transporter permease [Victivallales bacterium]|nr:metal ABC transporter permease [Victivallales bacterium]